jgi:hypothetical protein
MSEGIQVEVEGGFARIEFLHPSKYGNTLTALLEAGGSGLIDVDTSGTRKTYIVPESVAQQAGLLSGATTVVASEPAKKVSKPPRPKFSQQA